MAAGRAFEQRRGNLLSAFRALGHNVTPVVKRLTKLYHSFFRQTMPVFDIGEKNLPTARAGGFPVAKNV
jgi:hypothetical protein